MIQGRPRILRVMPNTPAMVFEGAFALCSDNDLADSEMKSAEELFQSHWGGKELPETLIDAVCGLSGGGPAYVAMFIESMADAGVKQGLPRATAYRLAASDLPWYSQNDSYYGYTSGSAQGYGNFHLAVPPLKAARHWKKAG